MPTCNYKDSRVNLNQRLAKPIGLVTVVNI
nr:MAG TPA: hypothetical protein [Caudoviricetes sp.]